MNLNYLKYAAKLPVVIAGITGIVNLVKGASSEDKKQAIVAAVGSSVSLAEFVAEKDLLNDPEVSKLMDALIEAESAAQKAREALKAAIVKRA